MARRVGCLSSTSLPQRRESCNVRVGAIAPCVNVRKVVRNGHRQAPQRWCALALALLCEAFARARLVVVARVCGHA